MGKYRKVHNGKRSTKINNDLNENGVIISYKKKNYDSTRFTACSISNLVDNIAEIIHKIKYDDCDCFLKYESVKGNLVKCKCQSLNIGYSIKIDEELRKRLKNTFTFSNNDINKFVLLLRKVVYPYEYMEE